MAFIKLLKDVPLDNSYKNPILFSDAILPDGMTKVSYDDFFNKFDENWRPTDTTGIKMNVKIGNGINTSIVVPEETYSPSYNYAVILFDTDEVRPSTNTGGFKGEIPYYFYFITDVVPLGKGNYVLNLELDVMTTYFPYVKLDHKVFTERKHCNRWQKDRSVLEWKDAILGDDIDSSFDAKLVASIDTGLIKYVNSTNTKPLTNVEFMNNWLSKTLWCYLFFTKTPSEYLTTQALKDAFTPLVIKRNDGQLYNTQLMCIAIPCGLMECWGWQNTQRKLFDYGTISGVFNKLTELDGCVGAKLSFRSPFCSSVKYYTDFPAGSNEINISPDGTSLRYYGRTDITMYNTKDSKQETGSTLIGNLKLYETFEQKTTTSDFELREMFLCVTELPETLITTKDILINQPNKDAYKSIYINGYKEDRNMFYEPKLYCKPFFNMVLTSQFGGSFEYNPLLFNNNYTSIGIYCEISPEPDKVYYYLISSNEDNSPYNKLKDINVGALVINDNNIPYRQDAYAQYLSQHRASAITGVAVATGTGVTAGGIAGASAGWGGAIAGALTGGILPVAKYIANLVDLRNTPDAIKNTGNNPVHDFVMNNDIIPHIISYELFESEKQQVYDYFYDNGYKVNRKCYLNLINFSNTEDIITRQKFNYIKLNEDITNEIKIETSYIDVHEIIDVHHFVPQIVKKKINSILNNGTKLWTLIYKNEDDATWEDFYLGSDFENAEIYLPQ